MIFRMIETVTKQLEIPDEEIIKDLMEEEVEKFRKLSTDEKKWDYLNDIVWDMAWDSDRWEVIDVDCDDSWVEVDFNKEKMKEI